MKILIILLSFSMYLQHQKESVVSYYAEPFHGRKTASGETYNKFAFTAASKTLPFGTYVLVTNIQNNSRVVVRINDRGPYINNRDLDLSEASFKYLCPLQQGITKIKYKILY